MGSNEKDTLVENGILVKIATYIRMASGKSDAMYPQDFGQEILSIAAEGGNARDAEGVEY